MRKKTLIKFASVIAVAVGVSGSVFGQSIIGSLTPAQYSLSMTALAATNMIAATSNIVSSLGDAVNVQTAGTVVLEFGGVGMGAAGTNGLILQYSRSLDGVNYETTPLISWTNTMTGTTALWSRTSFPASTVAAPWLKLVRMNNAANAVGVSNIVIRVSTQYP